MHKIIGPSSSIGNKHGISIQLPPSSLKSQGLFWKSHLLSVAIRNLKSGTEAPRGSSPEIVAFLLSPSAFVPLLSLHFHTIGIHLGADLHSG